MNVISPNGAVLTGDELKSYTERHGLCPICAETRTHKRPGKFLKKLQNRWEPLTVRNDAGEYLVYKGFCIQATCYSLEQAQKKLGERSMNDVNRRRHKYQQRNHLQSSFSSGSDAYCYSDRSSSCGNMSLDYSVPSTTRTDSDRSIEYQSGDRPTRIPMTDKTSHNRQQLQHHQQIPPVSPSKKGNAIQTTMTMKSPVDTSQSSRFTKNEYAERHGTSNLSPIPWIPPALATTATTTDHIDDYPQQARPSRDGSTVIGNNMMIPALTLPRGDNGSISCRIVATGSRPPYASQFSLKNRLTDFLAQTGAINGRTERILNLSSIELSEANVAMVLSALQEDQYTSYPPPSSSLPEKDQNSTSHLTTLIADHCKLGSVVMTSSSSSSLMQPSLSSSPPSPSLEKLLQGLPFQGENLLKLSLRSNGITNGIHGAKILAQYLPFMEHLVDVDLSKNKLEGTGALLVFKALSNNCADTTKHCLQKLNLSNNSIWDLRADETILSNFIRNTKRTLKVLNLENNYLRDSGIEQLCAALSLSPSPTLSAIEAGTSPPKQSIVLEKLYLANNSFRSKGAMALADLLRTNRSIRVLGIGQNSIENEGAMYLLDAITATSSIKSPRGVNSRNCEADTDNDDSNRTTTVSTAAIEELAGLYTNRISDKSIIKGIEQCLAEKTAKTFSDQLLNMQNSFPRNGKRTSLLENAQNSMNEYNLSFADIALETTDPKSRDDVIGGTTGNSQNDATIGQDLDISTLIEITKQESTSGEQKEYSNDSDIKDKAEAVGADSNANNDIEQAGNQLIILAADDYSTDDSIFSGLESKEFSRAETDVTHPDDSMSIASAESEDYTMGRTLESLLPLPTLYSSTSYAAGFVQESYRSALDALDLASTSSHPGSRFLAPQYHHHELKTVCLKAEDAGDVGFEAIAFTLGSHEEKILYEEESQESSNLSENVDASESGIEVSLPVGVEFYPSTFQESVTEEDCSTSSSSSIDEEAKEEFHFESRAELKFTSRAALEAEISECKKSLSFCQDSDDPEVQKIRIEMNKKLFASIHQRRYLPSRQELQEKIEELDIELETLDTSDDTKKEELRLERQHVIDLINKETLAEKALKVDTTEYIDQPERSRSIRREKSATLPLTYQDDSASNFAGRLTVFQSAPLSHVDIRSNDRHFFPLLDFEYEGRILKQALKDAQRIGAEIELEFEVATTDRLGAFFAQGGRRVLHLSCHGHPDYLALENGFGDMQPLPVEDLRRFLVAGEVTLDFVFVSACHSRSAGMAFLNAGVPHVVCCRQEARFRDEGAVEFARHFYRALACNKTLKQAFNMAREAIRVSPIIKDSALESDKFLLLPETLDADPYHDVTVFFADETSTPSTLVVPLRPQRILQRVPDTFLGREQDMYSILDALKCSDLVQVKGLRGSGKTCVVAAICKYIQQRQTAFLFDDVLWLPAPHDFVETDDQLYSIFSKIFSILSRQVVSSEETAGIYKECWSSLLRDIHDKRCLLIIDARRFATPKAIGNLDKFLSDLLAVSSVKVIMIAGNEQMNLRLPCRVLSVDPLDFETSAVLFSRLVQSAKCSPPELAAILTKVAPSRQNSKLYLKRKMSIFEKIGKGLPAAIELAAARMSEKELTELIRLAQRPLLQASTRIELEDSIQKALSEEATALRNKLFLKARDLRDQIEELQSLRAHLPSREEMEANITKLNEVLDKAVIARKYDAANSIQEHIKSIEGQIQKEKKSEEIRNEEKFNKVREKARKMHKENAILQEILKS